MPKATPKLGVEASASFHGYTLRMCGKVEFFFEIFPGLCRERSDFSYPYAYLPVEVHNRESDAHQICVLGEMGRYDKKRKD